MSDIVEKRSWVDAISAFTHPRVIAMLFLGFSAGVPILLIFSSLSLWLSEAGVKKSAVTYFSWAALGYSFKFVWAPIVDRLPLPVLGKWLGRRRSWLLLSQLAVIAAIGSMASIDPAQGLNSLTLLAFATVFLGFSSATQDIVIDAYRIESAGDDLQAMMSSSYIAGYRIGMIVAGAGALILAAKLGSTKDSYSYVAWQMTYWCMAGVMLIGVLTTIIVREPDNYQQHANDYNISQYVRFFLVFLLSVAAFIAVFVFTQNQASVFKSQLTDSWSNGHLAGLVVATIRLAVALAAVALVAWALVRLNIADRQLVRQSYVEPVRDFFRRYGLAAAWLLLALVGFYRVSDIVLGVIANIFYQDMGYSKEQIAHVSKIFGLLMTIAGGFLGGVLAMRYGVMRILFLGAVLSALTNLAFIGLSVESVNMDLLYLVIGADNLSAGLASAAFIAFLSSLTNIRFTAVQYAIFSSLMTLFPKVLGGYSGSMVESIGYTHFFIMTTLLTLPVLVLILIAARFLNLKLPSA